MSNLRHLESQPCDTGTRPFPIFRGSFDIRNSELRVPDVQPRTFFGETRTFFLEPTSSASGPFHIRNSAFQSKPLSGHQTELERSTSRISSLSVSPGKLPPKRGSFGVGELERSSSRWANPAENGSNRRHGRVNTAVAWEVLTAHSLSCIPSAASLSHTEATETTEGEQRKILQSTVPIRVTSTVT